jgi:uncharacterized OB-fold protein
MAGIAAVAFHLPRYVITANEHRKGAGRFDAEGIEEKRVPGFDEDAITMAVAAGERCLEAAGRPRVDILAYATSGALSGGALVAEALGIDPAQARDVRGSADAGETAMAGAIDAATKDGTTNLVIATDAPGADPPSAEEDASGGAAVALLVTPSGKVSWQRGSVSSQSVLRHEVGDVGAASVLLSFLTSVDPYDVVGDLDVGGALKARTPITYEQYVATRPHRAPPGTEYSQGAYVSLPAYLAEKKARYRLVGERCTACGRLHFPPREACLACGARSWEDVPLKRTGTVYSYTIIGKGAAPSEFLEQQLAVGEYATAVVALDDGPRVAAMLTDVEPAGVNIGMPVRMVFRRLYTQEGVTRYGFKFGPA